MRFGDLTDYDHWVIGLLWPPLCTTANDRSGNGICAVKLYKVALFVGCSRYCYWRGGIGDVDYLDAVIIRACDEGVCVIINDCCGDAPCPVKLCKAVLSG